MKALSKQEAVENHRIMWNWIAEETLIRKRKVYEINYFNEVIGTCGACEKDYPNNGCYCCEYVSKQAGTNEFGDGVCKYCPLDWKSKCNEFGCIHKNLFGDFNGLYSQWEREKDYEKCGQLASGIANLAER